MVSYGIVSGLAHFTFTDDSWRDTYFGKHELGALWLLIYGAIEKHLLTFLLTYLPVDWSFIAGWVVGLWPYLPPQYK